MLLHICRLCCTSICNNLNCFNSKSVLSSLKFFFVGIVSNLSCTRDSGFFGVFKLIKGWELSHSLAELAGDLSSKPLRFLALICAMLSLKLTSSAGSTRIKNYNTQLYR